jgi:hypothetical protein
MPFVAFAFALAAVSCDESVNDRAEVDAGLDEAKSSQTIALNWTRMTDHPARSFVEGCHLLDQTELAILWVEQSDDPDFAELAPYFGGPTQFPNDKARHEAHETYREKAWERFEAIADKAWCVSMQTTIGSYDFDTERLKVSGVLSLATDRTVSGAASIERAEIESGKKAGPLFELPLVVGPIRSPDTIAVPAKEVEDLLEDESDAGRPAIDERVRNLGKLHPAAIRAFFQADQPNPDESDEPSIFDEVQTELNATPSEIELVAVVVPAGAGSNEYDSAGTKLSMKFLGVHMTHVAVVRNGRVLGAMGGGDDGVFAKVVSFEKREHSSILAPACSEALRWDWHREYRDGAIVETVSPYCARCPDYTENAGSRETYSVEMAAVGDFAGDGTLSGMVSGMGCASRAAGEGYLATVRRDYAGSYFVSDSLGGLYSNCLASGPVKGRSILVCTQFYTGGGGAAEGSVVALTIGANGRIQQDEIVRLVDNWSGMCSTDSPFVWTQSVEKKPSGEIAVKVNYGTPGEGVECGDTFAGKVATILVEPTADGARIADESRAVIDTIEGTLGER